MIFHNKDHLFKSPLDGTYSFENLSHAVGDSSGNIYFIDDSLQEIGKVNSEGYLEFHIRPGQGDNTGYQLATSLSTDKKGNLYVIIKTLNKQGVFIKEEQVVKFDPQGRQEQVLRQVRYDEDKRPSRPGKFYKITVKDQNLYLYIKEGKKLSLERMTLDGQNRSKVVDFELPEPIYLSEISGTNPGEIYFTTKRAEIYRLDKNGQTTRLFQAGSNESTKQSFPKSLSVDDEGRVVFSDLGREEIVRILGADNGPESLEFETLYTHEDRSGSGKSFSLKRVTMVSAEQGQILVVLPDRLIQLNDQGEMVLNRQGVPLAKSIQFQRWFVWGAAFLFFVLFVFNIRLFYIAFLERRLSLVLKQSLILIPLIVLAMTVVPFVVYGHLSGEGEAQIFHKLKMMSYMASETIDTETVLSIDGPEDYMGDAYLALDRRNHHLLEGREDLDADAMYSSLYRVKNDEYYVLTYYRTSVGTYYPIEPLPGFEEAARNGSIETKKSYETDGEWMYAVSPIHDEQGNIIALQEIGISLASYNQSKRALVWNSLGTILMITLVVVVIFLVMTYFLLSSIRKLRDSALEISKGNWGTEVAIRSRDEVGELGRSFNLMSAHIRKRISYIQSMNEAYYRFVPEPILKILGKENILDVKRGDQVEEEMTILVTNVRSFYRLSGSLTPEENFDFVNRFLSRFATPIHSHSGFVNKYLESGMLALFPRTAGDALKAAIEMRKVLLSFNDERENEKAGPIEIGIGLHRGPLMLGIVGEEKKMESSVISDDVNRTLMLENLSEKFGVSILLTEEVMQEIPNPKDFGYRSLGMVYVGDRKEPMVLYDVYEGDPEELKNLKAKTKILFEEGIDLYQNVRFYDARQKFLQVIKHNPWDQVAKLYFYACDEYFQTGPPESWNGTLIA